MYKSLRGQQSDDHYQYGVINLMLIAILFALVLVVFATSSASAHLNKYGSSVRERRIDYKDTQPYVEARRQAVRQWNNTRVRGRVAIRLYDGRSKQEIYFYDVYQENGYAGYWYGGQNVPFPHKIKVNRYWMNRYNGRQRIATITHELGHALRLDHPPSTRYWKSRSIMFYCPACTSLGAPQRHDRDDYNRAWRVG